MFLLGSKCLHIHIWEDGLRPFCPFPSAIPGQGTSKNAHFLVKMNHDGRLPYQPKFHLETGKCDKTHPKQWKKICWILVLYDPSRCHSRSRWVRKWVFLGSKTVKMTGCHIKWSSTWKQDNGPKHTRSNGNICVGHFYALFRWQYRSWWVQKWIFSG